MAQKAQKLYGNCVIKMIKTIQMIMVFSILSCTVYRAMID
jgi:hypothetical protein